jgi:hypothetical protein
MRIHIDGCRYNESLNAKTEGCKTSLFKKNFKKMQLYCDEVATEARKVDGRVGNRPHL